MLLKGMSSGEGLIDPFIHSILDPCIFRTLRREVPITLGTFLCRYKNATGCLIFWAKIDSSL